MWSPDARSVSGTGRVSGFLCGQGAVDTNPSESLLRGTTVAVSLLAPPARSSAPGYRWGFLGCASEGAPPAPDTYPLSTRKESRQTLIFFFK